MAQRLAADEKNVVMSRKWFDSWKITGRQVAQQIIQAGARPGDRVIYTLYNEADNWAYGTEAEANLRADHELDAATILLEYGLRVAIGGFSVGCPNVKDSGIVRVLRRYAEVYNKYPACFFNQHLYSPSIAHVDAMDVWYEGRWRLYFDDEYGIGFNPRKRGIICDECGLDERGIGGFAVHGMTGAQIIDWCRKFQTYSSLPITVGGVTYSSPFIGGSIYQMSQGAGWEGYYVAPETISEVWK